MTIALVVGVALLAWCVLSLPLAVAVGRALRAGEMGELVMDQETVGV